MLSRFAIILAGGSGMRAGGDRPKQFREICGRPLLWWTVKAFHEADPDMRIILVIHPDYAILWRELLNALPPEERIYTIQTSGGKSRPESVRNGLNKVKDLLYENENPVILIHDGARPLVSPSMIRRGMDVLREGEGVIPVVKAVNSLRKLADSRESLETVESHSVDRAEYVEVQTPQIFTYSTIASAYAAASDLHSFTDDASVAEASGIRIALYEGESTNIKVTHPDDFMLAEILLRNRKN